MSENYTNNINDIEHIRKYSLSANDKNLHDFLTCPVPDNEEDRECVLRQTNLLDSDTSDPEFDRYTSLVKRIFNLPIVLVSLIDTDRQWFKSRVGLDAPQTHRNYAFCSYTVLPMTSEVFVVPDSDNDIRFKNNPLVTGPPFVKFYAGAALIVDGVKVGSLCAIDNKPRFDFTIEDQMTLLDFGHMVSNVIKRRRDISINRKNQYSKYLINIIEELRLPMKPLVKTLQQVDSLLYVNNNKSNDIKKNFNIIKSLINEIGFNLEININLCPVILNKPMYDDTSSDGNSIANDNMETSSEVSSLISKSVASSFSKGKECNLLYIISKAQDIVNYLPYSKNIQWLIDHTYLGLGSHVCYPEIFIHTILYQINKLSKIYNQILLFIGFKKAVRTDFSLPLDDTILTGKLSLDFRCSGANYSPVFTEDEMNYFTIIDKTTETIDKYYNLSNILSDINGSYHEIVLTNLQDLTNDSNCIQNHQLKFNTNLFEGSIESQNYNKENQIEKLFSFRLPCQINLYNIKQSIDTKILIISDDTNNNMIFCDWLRDLGYIVRLAKSAEEGLTLLKNVAYDILIVKISMAEKTGGTVLQSYYAWRNQPKSEQLKHINENIFIIGMSQLKQLKNSLDLHSTSYDSPSPLTMSQSVSRDISRQPSRPISFPGSPVPVTVPMDYSNKSSKDVNLNEVDNKLERYSAFAYGMHVYFSNPFDAKHILVYILKENKRHKEMNEPMSNYETYIEVTKRFHSDKVFFNNTFIDKPISNNVNRSSNNSNKDSDLLQKLNDL